MKIKPIILVLGLSLMMSGCTKNEKTNISTIDDNSNEIVEVNINEVENDEKKQEITNYFSDIYNNPYGFESKTNQSNTITVNYPVLYDFEGELTKDYINQSLESFAASVAEKYSELENITFEYDITKQSDNLFCVKLASSPIEDGIVYTEAITIDLASTNTVTSDILFLGNQDSVNTLIGKHSTDESETSYDLVNMIMVFENENITFIKKDDKGLVDKSIISIPVQDLIEFINIDFGEHPAS